MTSDVLREIDTIVVLMMESRSFDHLLGHLSLDGASHAGVIDGFSGTPIDGFLTQSEYANASQGRIYQPFELRDGVLPDGLSDARDATKLALGRKLATGYAMDGFVRAYHRQSEHQRSQRPLPMAFLRAGDAPVTNFLARTYAICDRWFAPLPTGSIPNRLMATCGVSNILDTPSNLLSHHPTVFDWLNNHGVRYRVYHDGLSFFTLCPWMLDDVAGDRFRDASRLIEDVVNEPDESFPRFIYVEPSYFDGPVRSDKEANDNRPPSSMAAGEKFLLSVYEALRANPARFQRTLFIVSYASSGGFYDHVSPLPVRHESMNDDASWSCENTGLRVPTIVVSPHVESGTVYHGSLDHTSILQLLADKFDGGQPYSAAVHSRQIQGIGSVSSVLNLPAPRKMIPAPPRAPRSRRRERHIEATSPSNASNAFYLAARALCDHSPSRVARTYPEFWREFAGADLM
jgi:phospholipase C